MNSMHSDQFNITLLRIQQDSNILNSHIVLEESNMSCVITIKNQISNKLVKAEADREELRRSNNLFTIRLVPWDSIGWDRTNCKSHGMR
jgi:hypothetical protein